MEGLQRRPSGVYVVRLAIPQRLRSLVGRREMLATTGVRDLAVAKIVASQLLASWRQRLLELHRLASDAEIDLALAVHGSPMLALGGHLSLKSASLASGLGQEVLLREAVASRLRLFYQATSLRGYRVPLEALPVTSEDGRWHREIPLPSQMPAAARSQVFSGVLAIPESPMVAESLLAGASEPIVIFGLLDGAADAFVPDEPVLPTREGVHLLAEQVEQARRRVAAVTTPEQVDAARDAASRATAGLDPNRLRPLSESIEKFLSDHRRPRGAEQSARVRGACELFLELMGPELQGDQLTRDLVRRFRDAELPRVPADENKVRLQYGTKSITESIHAVAGSSWPAMSVAQQVKRLAWVGRWLEWLGREGWAEQHLADGLVGGGPAGREVAKSRGSVRQQDRRDVFTDAELANIFGAQWFRDGAGVKTRAGTYRTWMPYRYWLPLMALLTGARLNEIAQLHIEDLRQSDTGVWLFDINSRPAAGTSKTTKKLKNPYSMRLIPIHSKLIELGLIEWRNRLQDNGHDRLFPELLFDNVKGYGHAVTKWFTGFMSALGLERNGRKVFHSFRHTVTNRLEQNSEIKSAIISQILGHERGESTTMRVYRKDSEVLPDGDLVRTVELLKFNCLDLVAPMAIDAGLEALADAIRRKKYGS